MLPKQTVNNVIKKLMDQGYVQLEAFLENHKNTKIAFTEQGQAYAQPFIAHIETAECEAMNHFSESQQIDFINFMKRYEPAFRETMQKKVKRRLFIMMKNLEPNVFYYGYPAPVLLVGTYNDDGTVNAMDFHECMRTNAGDLALCIGPRSKTHENIRKRRTFTVALVNQKLISEVDYFGISSGYRVPDKFERTGLKAIKSKNINAPIIEGSPLVIECELIEIVNAKNFTTVLARIVNVAAEESVLDKNGKINSLKTGMLLFDSFSNSYLSLSEKVGEAWVDGKKFL